MFLLEKKESFVCCNTTLLRSSSTSVTLCNASMAKGLVLMQRPPNGVEAAVPILLTLD